MPDTSVHVQDKNREISPLDREEGYGGKDLEKRWVLRREWKTLWDTPTTDLGAELESGNGGEHSEMADWPTVYGFLLVFFSNFVPKTHHFWHIRLVSIQWPWNPGWESL